MFENPYQAPIHTKAEVRTQVQRSQAKDVLLGTAVSATLMFFLFAAVFSASKRWPYSPDNQREDDNYEAMTNEENSTSSNGSQSQIYACGDLQKAFAIFLFPHLLAFFSPLLMILGIRSSWQFSMRGCLAIAAGLALTLYLTSAAMWESVSAGQWEGIWNIWSGAFITISVSLAISVGLLLAAQSLMSATAE